jgi:hypothetical protein
MKAHLLYRNQDIDLQRPLPWNEEALTRDLALNTLFNAMTRKDEFLFAVAKKVTLTGLDNDVETIRYRQEILQDCLKYPAVIRELYALAVEATETERKSYFWVLNHYPDSVLRWAVELLGHLLDSIKKLREMADLHVAQFASAGWRTFFAMLQRELNDDYIAHVQYHLEQLKFRHGVLLSAGLGKGNKGSHYVLHLIPAPRSRDWEWLRWAVTRGLKRFVRDEWVARLRGRRPTAFEFSLHPRDESGAKALAQLRDRGISLVANALGQSADHVRSFFNMLRTELAFYIGCLNLHEQLAQKGGPRCFPVPVAAGEQRLSFRGLYDVCLALTRDGRVVGNDVIADKQQLVLITGANQGGKSTFLRSVGLAQLMMQCGMFAPADAFSSSLYNGLFTHYRREEDVSMKSGKLDEELSRMSDLVSHITSHSMILFNESFAATNEREGSEIARQIVSALLEKGVRIVFVTHLYEFARGFHQKDKGSVLFLRAGRQSDGTRTFKLVGGEPLETSFGEDLYNDIFGAPIGDTRATPHPEESPVH